ncbi:MAG: hypothetical protein ABIF10_06720 [Candidatus Woesearchaeota archaeon]
MDSYKKYFHFFVGKLAVFRRSNGKWQVLVARRKGEKEYDDTYSFIGGRKESSDSLIIDNLGREKTEELGSGVRIRLFPAFGIPFAFERKASLW